MKEILSVEQMYQADAATIAGGVSGMTLMEAAGRGIAEVIRARWSPRPVEIWCGPGNNGGDGFVVARHLTDRGWPVRLCLLGSRQMLKGDAAGHAAQWTGPVEPLPSAPADDTKLVVDALFGAGLARPLEDPVAQAVRALNDSRLPCVAVDVPSGVNGNTGQVDGLAVQARATVTFCRAKPGHFLFPGRALAGDLSVIPIGIPDRVVEEMHPVLWRNDPALWRDALPTPGQGVHKYANGHLAVLGGAPMTGAARLAARGARRAGAGLVSLVVPAEAFLAYAADWPGTMVRPMDSDQVWADLLDDRRVNALVMGPGAGLTEATGARIVAGVASDRPCVIDADGLTLFATDRDRLFSPLNDRCVLTPHAGEFAKLFGDLTGSKLDRARSAAALSGAVVVFKGPDTVIAHPDGRAVINDNAPASLATGGTGDVLAGMIGALLARGMPSFDAACVGVWMHGRAAASFGPGLIAEDLPDLLPGVWRRLGC